MEITERAPLVLIACSDEWMSRSLESVFAQNGYSAVRVASGNAALKLARRSNHDVVFLDESLDDLNSIEVCRALQNDPLFDKATPIVVTSLRVTARTRALAYGAGAWEFCSQPLDFTNLFLKLVTYTRARNSLTAARADCMVDPTSGIYTELGLEQVATQLSARALRDHEPFACVAISPYLDDVRSPDRADRESAGGFADIAHMFRSHSRKSDVVGKMSDSRLAILAPDTDANGARLLVARLQRALEAASKSSGIAGAFQMHAGYCAVADFAAAKLDLPELVLRAGKALNEVRANRSGERQVLGFDELGERFDSPTPR